MKFKSKWDYHDYPMLFSLQQAVASECVGANRGEGGQLEDLQNGLESTAQFVGRLVGALHDSGALSQDDLLSMLPSYSPVEE